MVVACERAGIKGGHAEVLNGKYNSSRSQPETVHNRVAEMSEKPLLIKKSNVLEVKKWIEETPRR